MLASVRSLRKELLASLLQMSMNIFSSLRTFQSFCEICQKDVVLNSSILVNFVTRSALQKCELNYNSWPQFVLTNKRLFPIHSHFRKYSPLHFIQKAGAALVKTIASFKEKSRVYCSILMSAQPVDTFATEFKMK